MNDLKMAFLSGLEYLNWHLSLKRTGFRVCFEAFVMDLEQWRFREQ